MMERRLNMDRLITLPWDILETILVHLPLRDAVRTSAFSSAWKYKWTGLSEFVFDDKCFLNSSMDSLARWNEFEKVTRQIILHHSGPIEKFKLASYCRPNNADLDRWILYLTAKGIKELILRDFEIIKRYRLPSCLNGCESLTHLELYGCIIQVPLNMLKGFSSLSTLCLSRVRINGKTLEMLVCNCPVLERLTLIKLDYLSCLKIQNPNLKYLKVHTKFWDIYLENIPLLTEVDISPFPVIVFGAVRNCNLIRIMSYISGIKRLTLSNHYLQFFAHEDMPERLPVTLKHLVALEFKGIEFKNLFEVRVWFSILRSSPNLERLVLSVSSSENLIYAVEFLKAQHGAESFHKLRVVTIKGLLFTWPVWEFIKLILARSPILETMTIINYGAERFPDTLLRQVDHASEDVKIVSLTL